jgi:uncharacterized repeat protein (TIGR03803 family)
MPIFHRLRRLAAALLLVPLVAGIQPLAAAERTQTANVLKVVSLGDPPEELELEDVPRGVRGDLLLASDGNIYFASAGGGKGFGGVGRLAPDGTLSVVHAFADDGSEGLSAYGGLIQASDGNLYGTTFFGGDAEDSVGTVFKLTLAGAYTHLHDFVISGNKDPRKPYTGLAEGPDGNLYGTTLEGGNSQRGTIFRISTSGAFSVIHHFRGGDNDGATPEGQLIVGTDGKLYGTTMLGGNSDRGVIYRISTDGQYEQLYSFPGLRSFNDVGLATNSTGANPRAGLMLSTDGNYYGTTFQGGEHGNGTLYRMALSGGSVNVTVVHAFQGGPFDAGFPLSTVTQGPDGSFYGTSLHGGYGYNITIGDAGYTDSGTAWRVAQDGSSSELLHSFFGSSADGSQPYAGLLFANGALYAIGSSDDSTSSGVIINLQTDTGSGLPVELTISDREITLGESMTVSWNAAGAQTCDKSGGDGAWEEPTSDTDPEHITPVIGSKTLTPPVGIYTYMLSCTDANDVVHHAFVGVLVNPPVLETVDGGEIIGGGTLSWLLLALLAALLIRKFLKETRSSCP